MEVTWPDFSQLLSHPRLVSIHVKLLFPRYVDAQKTCNFVSCHPKCCMHKCALGKARAPRVSICLPSTQPAGSHCHRCAFPNLCPQKSQKRSGAVWRNFAMCCGSLQRPFCFLLFQRHAGTQKSGTYIVRSTDMESRRRLKKGCVYIHICSLIIE